MNKKTVKIKEITSWTWPYGYWYYVRTAIFQTCIWFIFAMFLFLESRSILGGFILNALLGSVIGILIVIHDMLSSDTSEWFRSITMME